VARKTSFKSPLTQDHRLVAHCPPHSHFSPHSSLLSVTSFFDSPWCVVSWRLLSAVRPCSLPGVAWRRLLSAVSSLPGVVSRVVLWRLLSAVRPWSPPLFPSTTRVPPYYFLHPFCLSAVRGPAAVSRVVSWRLLCPPFFPSTTRVPPSYFLHLFCLSAARGPAAVAAVRFPQITRVSTSLFII
jgi:hypothetical protein